MATKPAEKPKEKNPLLIVRDQIESRSNEFARVLPKHMDKDRFVRVVLTAIQLNTDLIACSRQSLWNACMKAASDGLLPDGREGAIVPFGDQAQWMPMVGGLLKRFRNSGEFKSITANIVREHEHFEYFIDENGEHLKHVPGDGGGKPVKAYAAATLINGGTMIRVMTEAEINKRRNVSRTKGKIWTDWQDEMWLKTVLRNLSKRLPMSSDLDELIRSEDEDDMGRPFNVTEALDHFSAPSSLSNPPPHSEPVQGSNPKSESEPEQASNPSSASEPSKQSNPEQESEPIGSSNPNETSWPEQPSNPRSNSDEITKAYDEGVAAHQSGIARRAVPGEYRTVEATHLAKAWWSGWDAG